MSDTTWAEYEGLIDTFYCSHCNLFVRKNDKGVCPKCGSDDVYVKSHTLEKQRKENPKDSMAVTKAPLGLLPAAARIWGAVALYCGSFLSPRNDGGHGYCPYNWRKTAVRASIYLDAMDRHLTALREGEWYDQSPPSNGFVPHAAFIIASAAILLDAKECHTLVDDRYEGPGAALLETVRNWLKNHPIPSDFDATGSGPQPWLPKQDSN